MLFDYAYLIKDFDAGFFNNANEQINEFIIPVNEQVTGKKPELFQQLLHSKNQFCFYIPFELTKHDKRFLKEEVIQNIVRLLFLPNYMRIKGKYIFFIEETKGENKNSGVLISELFSELKLQGINDVIIEVLKTEPSFENTANENSFSLFHFRLNKYLSSDSSEDCFEMFTREFILPLYFYKKWIVPVSNPDGFRHKVQLIEKFENWIAANNPFNIQLIEMYKLANKEGTELKLENKILKFKLENSAYSLKLIRDESHGYYVEIASLRREVFRLAQQINNPEDPVPAKSDPSSDSEEIILQLQKQILTEHSRANDISAWYKKEYEVLPLWYKKFGHIIKVFQGKRTFKSLFK